MYLNSILNCLLLNTSASITSGFQLELPAQKCGYFAFKATPINGLILGLMTTHSVERVSHRDEPTGYCHLTLWAPLRFIVSPSPLFWFCSLQLYSPGSLTLSEQQQIPHIW